MMDFRKELLQNFNEAVSFDPQILRSYDHDVGEMPGALMMLVKHRPQAVVVARSSGDVSGVLRIARKYGVPVTPRGQATSGYGGSVPSRGGILLDLCSFNNILKIDAEKLEVDVEPGIVWEELSRRLEPRGMDVRVCPTSAPSSTVGGWFSMGGVGIGSLRYGSVRDNVIEIDVAAPDGSILTLGGRDMEPFHQTCGALGVVTRLRLACRKAESMLTPAVALPDAASVIRFLDAAAALPLYSACAQSAEYCAMRAKAEGHVPAVAEGFLLSLALPADRDVRADIAELAAAVGGTAADDAVGKAEWEGRYYPMRIKKTGPSLLVGEYVVPFEGFAVTLDEVRAALAKDRFGVEAFAVKGKTLAVLVYLPDNAKDFLYPLRMVKAVIPIRAAAKHGGRPYATGMWFAASAKSVYGEEKFTQVEQLKKTTDPSDILNPGKIRGPGLPFLPFINLSGCILAATAAAAPLAAALPYTKSRRQSSGGKTS
jgi:FAD/FMN-containing dehydrogenase